jgi:hypothetical protein
LKPDGRALVIDFAAPAPERKSFLDRLHHRHSHVELKELIALLKDAGLNIVESGGVRKLDLRLFSRRGHDTRIKDR